MATRNTYTFSRPLSAEETELLTMLISWRRGSSVIVTGTAVTGCVAHPDDIEVFERRMRRQGKTLNALQLQA